MAKGFTSEDYISDANDDSETGADKENYLPHIIPKSDALTPEEMKLVREYEQTPEHLVVESILGDREGQLKSLFEPLGIDVEKLSPNALRIAQNYFADQINTGDYIPDYEPPEKFTGTDEEIKERELAAGPKWAPKPGSEFKPASVQEEVNKKTLREIPGHTEKQKQKADEEYAERRKAADERAGRESTTKSEQSEPVIPSWDEIRKAYQVQTRIDNGAATVGAHAKDPEKEEPLPERTPSRKQLQTRVDNRAVALGAGAKDMNRVQEVPKVPATNQLQTQLNDGVTHPLLDQDENDMLAFLWRMLNKERNKRRNNPDAEESGVEYFATKGITHRATPVREKSS